jgi:histone deacetylase 8
VHHSAPGFFPVSTLSQLPALSTGTSFDPFTLSLPLRQGASDSTFTRIWKIVEQVKDAFEPDYIILQCGLDSLSEDPCATFNWSLTSLGRCVDRVINHWKGRKLLLGGGKSPRVLRQLIYNSRSGGYHNANAARVWAYLTSIAVTIYTDF